MKQRLSRPKHGRSAFTLIEIMVATAVMVILVGLVIQITNEVLKVWNRSAGKLSANSARIAMELLTQDLETAVFRDNGMQWLQVAGPIDAGDDYANQTVALKLFAPALDRPKTDDQGNAIPGDICGIAYRLAYKEAFSESSTKVYALYRRIVDARTTFNNLMGSGNQETLTGGEWAEFTVTDESNYLVTNIVDFKVIVYYQSTPSDSSIVAEYNGGKVGDSWTVTRDFIYGGTNASTVSERR